MRAPSGALRLVVLTVLVCAGAGAAAGQVTPGPLTLDDALRLAEGSNPAYRRATNDVLLNGTEMRTAWLERLLPTASVQLFTNFWGNLQRQARDNFGNPIVDPQAEWVYFSQTTQNLNLSWSVQGPSLFQEHRRQTLVNRGRDLARDRVLTDVQASVRRRYMEALEQRDLMESETELLEARRIDLDVAERLFSLALRTRVDVLNAELAVEQQALALRQQEGAYQTALLELWTALGTDDRRPTELAREPLPIFDPSGFDPDALVRRALDVNPALRESSLAVETASQGLAETRNAWWPRVSFGLDVYRRAQTEAAGALFDPAFGQDLESQFFVQLSVPVLNGFFGQQESRQQAAVNVRNQREADREARLGIERDVRGAVVELDNQWASLRLSERSREIAEEALRLAREEYRLGTGSFEDLRASFDNEAGTRRQVITARHAFVEALLRLEEAVGAALRPPPGAGPGQSDGGPRTAPAQPAAATGTVPARPPGTGGR